MSALKLKADIMWANLDRPNEMSGKYQVDLCNLSQAAVKALSSLGITPKEKEDKGFFITCKSTLPIHAYDMDGNLLEERVGNGSKAIAMIGPFAWKFKNKEGVSPSLKKLVVEELVRYDRAEPIEEFDEDEVL